MTTLLGANVLIAFVVADHVHHDPAEEWFTRLDGPFATCPITQGSLLRILIRQGQHREEVRAVLTALPEDPRHEFRDRRPGGRQRLTQM